MCGIAGFCDFTENLRNHMPLHRKTARKMAETLVHRGPDDGGEYVADHAAFAHRRLAVIDPARGQQPMVRKFGDYEYAIAYNGELYNTDEIRKELLKKGYAFETASDTEVLLLAYVAYGKKVTDYLNGIYGFAIWDGRLEQVLLVRDRFGVKPLFYMQKGNQFLFASEIKGIFAFPGTEPVINTYGLCEIFGLGPARSPGVGVYEGICELPPASVATVDYSGLKIETYWSIKAEKHKENYDETVEHTRELLFDAIERQLVSDVPIATLLSGGLDSSVVSAVAARYFKKQGRTLQTYSFDYLDNRENFRASSFQPEEDRPYVDRMVEAIGSEHTYLECGCEELYQCLYRAVEAKDLPGMTDVDSSLLAFASKIKQNHTVCLSGECADEIFGGYPWFRDKEVYERDTFPWSKDLNFRKEILNPELLKRLPLDDYVRCQYEKTMSRVPLTGEESGVEKRQKEISILNTSWFMNTLLDRKDRMTMASGLEVRVPFADHRLIAYLYNVPWEYKYHNQEVKGLLKDASREVLPEEVLRRKKCPYPKTYDPNYETMLKKVLREILSDREEPVNELVNASALKALMDSPSDYGRPWFGQLMALPQMYAYLIEINYWLKKYQVKLSA